jgi:hypothetical protein
MSDADRRAASERFYDGTARDEFSRFPLICLRDAEICAGVSQAWITVPFLLVAAPRVEAATIGIVERS